MTMPSPDQAESFRILSIDGAQPLNAKAVAAVAEFCQQIEDGPRPVVGIVQLTGFPSDNASDDVRLALVNKWERALRRLERLPVPTVCVLADDCGGTAFELLMATDYRIAVRTASLVPQRDSEGMWPGMSLYRIANQVGVVAARRVSVSQGPIAATRALDLNLIDEVAEDMTAALQRAREVSGSASREYGVRRQLIFDAAHTSFENALGSHLAACDRVLRHTAEPLRG